jgi:phytoene dehydrogenase-like protein
MDSFLNSTWRVEESSKPLADGFVKALEALEGELRCKALVERILCGGGNACGVRIESGEEIASDLVIYTGHPRNVLDLCYHGSFRPAYRSRLEGSTDTFGVFKCVYPLESR